MAKRIPASSFEYYINLGEQRSYAAVAERYGVHKRSITKFAARHRWSERLAAIDADAREKSDKELAESWQGVRERQLKVYRTLQGKALQALQSMPLNTASAIVRALDVALKGEQALIRPKREQETKAKTLEEMLTESWELGGEPISVSLLDQLRRGAELGARYEERDDLPQGSLDVRSNGHG